MWGARVGWGKIWNEWEFVIQSEWKASVLFSCGMRQKYGVRGKLKSLLWIKIILLLGDISVTAASSAYIIVILEK